ncbi:MAG: hypothetical protein IJ906_05345 [Oscillospiraceae bacterium]|nr:hypothetical protein [Oscillospiraceae bacterium]
MNEKKPFDTLFDADDQTVSRIAAQCPPDWDDTDVFERSYRKYQAKRSGKLLRTPRRIEIQPLRALVTAACLMIAVGGAGGIWFFRYGVQKPQMTVDVEHAPTEQTTTSTETTATTGSTVKSTTAPVTTAPPETVSVIPESIGVLHTTAAVTSQLPASTTVVTVTEPVTALQTTAAVQSAQQQTTAVTQMIPETSLAYATQTAPVQTAPAQTTAAADDATEGGAVPVEPVQSETTAQNAADQPADAADSGSAGGTAAPVGGTETGGSFQFKEENGWKKITFQPDAVIPIEKAQLSIDLPGYTLEETDSHDTYSRLFQIRNPETGDNCQLRHYSYGGFQGSYKLDSMEMREVSINGRTGYLLYTTGQQHVDPDGNDNLYTLFWDDGTGISMISDVDAGGKNTIKIAEAIITATD